MSFEIFAYLILAACGVVNGVSELLMAIIDNTVFPRVLFAIAYFACSAYILTQIN